MATIWDSKGSTNTKKKSVVKVKADVIRYVNAVKISGWIKPLGAVPILGKNEPLTDAHVEAKEYVGIQLSLCKYTKVMLLRGKKNTTYFKILDGNHSGKTASMSTQDAAKFLGKKAPKKSAHGLDIVVTYGKYEENSKSGGSELDHQWASLSADGLQVKVTMNSVWVAGAHPLPEGTYLIQCPDRQHDTHYRTSEPNLKYDQVWFCIEYGNNSRFIHPGLVSAGCATVVDFDKWAELHEKLISHRSTDNKHVGRLIVKGKPQRAK
jgi:hypothetical protein